MTDESPTAESLAELARGKLVRVLGEAQGARIYVNALASVKLETITTPDELKLFADELSRAGGMVGAVGGILGVAATLRGAR